MMRYEMKEILDNKEIRNARIQTERKHYFREGATVVTGEAVGFTKVCQLADVVMASRPSKLPSPS